MRIKARMGMSADGYIATADGTPSLINAAAFEPGRSHGYPEFIDGCDTVVMGRQIAEGDMSLGQGTAIIVAGAAAQHASPAAVIAAAGATGALCALARTRNSPGPG